MSIEKIRTYPDPVLRKKTVKVKNPLDHQVQSLIASLLETMRKTENGIGLAAPQIGSDLRVCVIELDDKNYVFINPTISAKSKEKIITEEGCLSFPGKYYPISRSEEVKVRYLDQEGKNIKLKASGMLSRAIQHEVDHLNGILMIDRIKKIKIKNKKNGKK